MIDFYISIWFSLTRDPTVLWRTNISFLLEIQKIFLVFWTGFVTHGRHFAVVSITFCMILNAFFFFLTDWQWWKKKYVSSDSVQVTWGYELHCHKKGLKSSDKFHLISQGLRKFVIFQHVNHLISELRSLHLYMWVGQGCIPNAHYVNVSIYAYISHVYKSAKTEEIEGERT